MAIDLFVNDSAGLTDVEVGTNEITLTLRLSGDDLQGEEGWSLTMPTNSGTVTPDEQEVPSDPDDPCELQFKLEDLYGDEDDSFTVQVRRSADLLTVVHEEEFTFVAASVPDVDADVDTDDESVDPSEEPTDEHPAPTGTSESLVAPPNSGAAPTYNHCTFNGPVSHGGGSGGGGGGDGESGSGGIENLLTSLRRLAWTVLLLILLAFAGFYWILSDGINSTIDNAERQRVLERVDCLGQPDAIRKCLQESGNTAGDCDEFQELTRYMGSVPADRLTECQNPSAVRDVAEEIGVALEANRRKRRAARQRCLAAGKTPADCKRRDVLNAYINVEVDTE